MANVENVPRKRSASSPSLSIEAASAYIAKLAVHENDLFDLGQTGWSREDALRIMELNPTSGRSNRYLASMLQYGLLESQGDVVLVSELGRRVASGTAAPEDLAQAFENVDVFRRVRRDLADRAATEENCAPLFQKADVFTPDVFEIFEEAARQAKLLDAAGRFVAPSFEPPPVVETKAYRFGIEGEVMATLKFFGPVAPDTVDYLKDQVAYLCIRHNARTKAGSPGDGE